MTFDWSTKQSGNETSIGLGFANTFEDKNSMRALGRINPEDDWDELADGIRKRVYDELNFEDVSDAREMVIKGALKGESNDVIADRAGITEQTAGSYKSQLVGTYLEKDGWSDYSPGEKVLEQLNDTKTDSGMQEVQERHRQTPTESINSLLEDNDGVLLQKDLNQIIDYSDAYVSMKLSEMEKEGEIERYQDGKTKRIEFPTPDEWTDEEEEILERWAENEEILRSLIKKDNREQIEEYRVGERPDIDPESHKLAEFEISEVYEQRKEDNEERSKSFSDYSNQKSDNERNRTADRSPSQVDDQVEKPKDTIRRIRKQRRKAKQEEPERRETLSDTESEPSFDYEDVLDEASEYDGEEELLKSVNEELGDEGHFRVVKATLTGTGDIWGKHFWDGAGSMVPYELNEKVAEDQYALVRLDGKGSLPGQRKAEVVDTEIINQKLPDYL